MATEADAIKKSMALILEEIYAHPEWDAKMCSFVHDELDFEVKEAFAKPLARVVLYHMNTCMSEVLPDVPAYDETVAAENLICDSWADK